MVQRATCNVTDRPDRRSRTPPAAQRDDLRARARERCVRLGDPRLGVPDARFCGAVRLNRNGLGEASLWQSWRRLIVAGTQASWG